MKNKSILKISFIAMFAAIISFSSFLKIPLGPIPIVLQNMFCILCAVLIGGILGSAPVALFLFAGLIGLPVYSGFTSGIAVWVGPTGGFLAGYFLGALIASLIAGSPKVQEKKISAKTAIKISIAILCGMIIIYIPGVIHFAKWATAFSRIPEGKSVFTYTLVACVIPYIPGDIIKCVIAIPVALKVRPILAQYLYSKKHKGTFSDKNNESL
ncbi:MAG: biotin transporter BioY [Treponema sp.]|jgi:biotin transport system substrate-specific component|nr:biotin transporter BioY [Treponema sp.]